MSNETGPRRGLMFVLSSPSGAGKSTLARALLAREPNLTLSVSMTTRPARPGEVDGREYRFATRDAFERAIEAGAFLEWARVFDHLYGTPKAPVDAALAAGRDVLFDVDWQGARALRAAAADDVIDVFILPPDMAELERRLHARAQDDPAVIARRMARSADEIRHWDEYDYVLVNRDLADTEKRLEEILSAERQKRARQTWLAAFVQALLAARP